MEHGAPGDLNQALMDVGATRCAPDAPACGACPLKRVCAAHARGTPEAFPGRKPGTPRAPLAIAFALVEGPDGLLLEQRPLDGLWPGLWEPPSATGPAGKSALERRLGRRLSPRRATVLHTLSHKDVVATVHTAHGARPIVPTGPQRVVADPLGMPLSSLAKKAILAWRALPPARRSP
jgi:adenine-specific DNA glycosylase